MFSRLLVRIVALTLILAGCGTKGPLTMPPRNIAKPPANTAPAPAPAPVTVPEDDSKAPAQ
jgi:predicted small lipoprotein YifL